MEDNTTDRNAAAPTDKEALMIRKCGTVELGRIWPRLADIFDEARMYMRRNGNSTQWTNGYPDRRTIEKDVAEGHFYLVSLRERIVACFCLRPSPEPTYAKIYNGRWPDDKPYHVIHRLASDGSVRGIAQAVIDYCKEKGSLRADTHEQNRTMIHILENAGFDRCGTIYVDDGTPRIAFHMTNGNI